MNHEINDVLGKAETQAIKGFEARYHQAISELNHAINLLLFAGSPLGEMRRAAAVRSATRARQWLREAQKCKGAG